jgi:hypothetical protein
MPNTKSTAKQKKSSVQNGKGMGNTQLETLFVDTLKDIYWQRRHLP